MRRLRFVPMILAGSLVLLITSPLPAGAVPGSPEFRAGFTPPGLLVRGDPVALDVHVETPTFYDPPPRGNAYVKGDQQAAFIRVPLVWDPDYETLNARVPTRALAGSVLDEYVIVRDPASGRSLTVPPAGAQGPYRSWILDDSPTVSLGKHRFGHLRAPDSIVARAKAGDGPGEVGFYTPGQGPEEAPSSFDVGSDGAVWVLDEHHGRLLKWDPGQPDTPSRSVPLTFGPADLAVGPDGTVYVSGARAGDRSLHTLLYAFSPNGRTLWTGHLLTELFNAHIRVGPGGVVYGEAPEAGGWAPATDRHGRPLDVVVQGQRVRPYLPVSGSRQLVVAGTCSGGCDRHPTEALIGLASASGALQRSWRIDSADTPDEFDVAWQDTTPAAVGGVPVVVFAVYDFKKHLMEHLVVRLSPKGTIAERYSLGRGAWGVDVFTGVRVGSDGALYQMQTNPKWGLKIARYSLEDALTARPTPTASPTPTARPTPTAATVPAPLTAPAAGPPPVAPPAGWSLMARLGLTLGSLALLGAVVAAVWWRRRTAGFRRARMSG